MLSVLPADTPKITTINNFPDLARSPSGDSDENGSGMNGTNGNGSPMTKRRKKAKGWAGETIDPNDCLVPLDGDVIFLLIIPRLIAIFFDLAEAMFTCERSFETELSEDGSAITHIVVECTLVDIARATNLRVDDAAFALNECGLLAYRLGEVHEDGTVVLTRKLVEQIAVERNVKKPCMLPAYVKLQ